jgi:hypothetical protein
MEGRSVRSASSAIRLGLTVDRLTDLSFIHPSASEAMIWVFQDHSIGQGTKDQNANLESKLGCRKSSTDQLKLAKRSSAHCAMDQVRESPFPPVFDERVLSTEPSESGSLRETGGTHYSI